MPRRKARRTTKPYGLVARFYEDLTGDAAAMNHHARDVILADILPRCRRVLDVACGNGATALDLAQHGLEVEALDLSPVFVRKARARTRAQRAKVHVQRADMRDFKVRRPVDLSLCEFSAINNLEQRGDLAQVLRCVARALVPGGWFLVDVNSPLAFSTQYAQGHFFDTPRFKLTLHSTLEDGGRRARIECEWFLPVAGRRYRHVKETIINVCWTAAELRRALRAAGFGSIRVFDGVDVRPRMPGAVRGTDLYFLCRKRAK